MRAACSDGRPGLVLTLEFWPEPRSEEIRFVEAYTTGRFGARDTTYAVAAPMAAMPLLVERFETRLDVSPALGRMEDRLIGCFTALAARGHLGEHLPRLGNRAVVADWITAAGVTPTLTGFARVEHLLRVHRTATDCIYELTLTMDPAAYGGPSIVFREHYEYLPNAGDPGREYSYLVTAPYDSLAVLVTHLENEPGAGDPEERLARWFHDRVRTADLHPGLGRQQARDLVAHWFTQAGVSATTDESHWFNSDWPPSGPKPPASWISGRGRLPLVVRPSEARALRTHRSNPILLSWRYDHGD